MIESNCKPHAIIISIPFQGHINPTVNLALKLASKGITVTFAHLEFVHHMLSKAKSSNTGQFDDPFSFAKDAGLDIRYATISDGFPLEYDRSLNRGDYWWHLYINFPALVDDFIGKTIRSTDPSLDPFIVADTCYAWLPAVANKYNLVSVSFWTESALVFSLYYHSEGLLKEHGHFPCQDGIEEDISYLPGVDSINTRDIMPCLKKSEYEGIECKTILMAFEEVKKVDFVLHNTVQELEPGALIAINKHLPSYAVGPINFSTKLATNVTNSLRAASDCTQWLHSKPPGTVLYVSFGSISQANRQVIQEIASGLALSEVNFIWVIRPDLVSSDETNVLPDGFENEIKDRGLIVPWCDQIMVLSEPAVGGFLTHCGWNSISESIWCGVPMICYPIEYDQPTNRKLVVDDWKIGVSLCDGTSVEREKVAKTVRNFMCLGEMKQEIKKVKATLHAAVDIGGSSESNLEQFILDLKAKINTLAQNAEPTGNSPQIDCAQGLWQ